MISAAWLHLCETTVLQKKKICRLLDLFVGSGLLLWVGLRWPLLHTARTEPPLLSLLTSVDSAGELSVEIHLCPGMFGAPAARTSRRVQDIALLHGVWRCDWQMCVPRCGPAKKKNIYYFFIFYFFYTSSFENPRNTAEERAYFLWKFNSPRPKSSYLTLRYSNYSHYGEPLVTSSRR